MNTVVQRRMGLMCRSDLGIPHGCDGSGGGGGGGDK